MTETELATKIIGALITGGLIGFMIGFLVGIDAQAKADQNRKQ